MAIKANSPLRYDSVAMTLHWSIAVLILVDIGLAVFFNRFNFGDRDVNQAAYQWHMSIGMCVLALSVLRVIWRLLRTYPALPRDMGIAMRALAKTAHLLLYLFILVAPLSGWIVASLRRQTASMLGLFDWPALTFFGSMTREQRRAIYDVVLPFHMVLSYAGIALVVGHVCAALHHHFFRHDDVLERMWPRLRGATGSRLARGSKPA
jgi:cytochrome b561